MGVDRSERGADAVPPADVWTVVGGCKTNGIVVREGCSLDSKEVPDRLSTGALICTVTQQGNRLLYSLINGSGPERGWISIRLNCSDLLVRLAPVTPLKAPKQVITKSHDLMEACLVEAKKLMERTPLAEPAQPRLPQETSKAKVMAWQDTVFTLMANPEVQKRLVSAWTSAKGDARKQESERRRVCLEVWAETMEIFGFPVSWEGVAKCSAASVRALGQELYEDDQIKRQILIKWVQTPDYQMSVPFTLAEVRDHVNSLRDPASAFLEARFGGFVGRWQFVGGHFEIVAVDSQLKITIVCFGEVSRGELHVDDIWHTALLSNGVGVRIRHDVPQQLRLSMDGPFGWTEEWVAQALKERELTSCREVEPDVVSSVRRLATSWSVVSAGPPDEPELRDAPHPLLQLACDRCDERQEFLDECLALVEEGFPTRGAKLVYASCGVLWLDWWLLEGLLVRGYHIDGAHFIHKTYIDVVLRTSGRSTSPLGDMAGWLRACGVCSFAHESLTDFSRRVPAGAHVLVLVQCDACELDVACPALHTDGLLFSGDAAARLPNKMVCP